MKIGIQTWGSEGDVRPLYALADGLVNHGHEVTLVVTGVAEADYGSIGKDVRFKLVNRGHVSYDEAFMLDLGKRLIKERNPLKQVDLILTEFFDPVADEMMNDARNLSRENDLLIRHFIASPLGIAAELNGRPCISVYTVPPPIPTKYRTPYDPIDLGQAFVPFLRKLGERGLNRFFRPRINHMRQKEGLAPIRSVMRQGFPSEKLNLIALSPSLLEAQPDWEDRFRICGFFNLPDKEESWQLPDNLTEFFDAGPPPVYVTFGSIMAGDPNPERITKLLIEAVLSAKCRAIIQSRWDMLDGIPEHPQIYRITRAPHKFVFPRCAAVVHAGGAGTTQTATLAGCPSIIVAHASDQTLWGAIMKKKGAAPDYLHRRSLTAAKLAKSIRSVLETPAMKKKAEELGSRMKKENGIERAIELIHAGFGDA